MGWEKVQRGREAFIWGKYELGLGSSSNAPSVLSHVEEEVRG